MKDKFNLMLSLLEDDAKKVASSLDFLPLEGKTVLVTGGNGLIGMHFVMSLVELSKSVKNIKIIAVIRSEPIDIFTALANSSQITILKGDLTDATFLETLPTSDVIIHAAGSGIPSEFLKNKLASVKINTLSTFRLFDKLNSNGKFLFISSSDVYNGLDSNLYSEDQIGSTNTNHPRACYIEGKRTGEAICNIYHERGLSAHAVRLSLTYGPGISYSDSRVLPSFIRKALNGSIQLLDSGEASRTFCYVSDAVEMMWFVLLHGKEYLYNIGGAETTTVRELASIIGKQLKVPVDFPVVESAILGAPQNVKLDITRYTNEAHKSEFVNLETGLQKTIAWLKLLKEVDDEKGV